MRTVLVMLLGLLTLAGFGLGIALFVDTAKGRAGGLAEIEALICILIGTVALGSAVIATAIDDSRRG